MRGCLGDFYGSAVDDLPYDGREGGYQAPHWDTYDLLFDQLGLDLPRDKNNKLRYSLPDRISEEIWCEYDWLSLDLDQALEMSWERFCEIVKHRRRFFFHGVGADPDDRDLYAPSALLRKIGSMADGFGLVVTLPVNTCLFRARPDKGKGASHLTAEALGPPPAELALQSNRMNPPGIPMMYGATERKTALLEVRAEAAFVGEFKLCRPARVLDLADLPKPPGIFSGSGREKRLGLIFLNKFRNEIMKPVARDDRIHVEYIPSQIATEFFRGYQFSGHPIDGIKYPSALDGTGQNLVLFATTENLGEADDFKKDSSKWIELVKSYQVSI